MTSWSLYTNNENEKSLKALKITATPDTMAIRKTTIKKKLTITTTWTTKINTKKVESLI